MHFESESTQKSDMLSDLFENYDSDWSIMTSYININTAQANEMGYYWCTRQNCVLQQLEKLVDIVLKYSD